MFILLSPSVFFFDLKFFHEVFVCPTRFSCTLTMRVPLPPTGVDVKVHPPKKPTFPGVYSLTLVLPLAAFQTRYERGSGNHYLPKHKVQISSKTACPESLHPLPPPGHSRSGFIFLLSSQWCIVVIGSSGCGSFKPNKCVGKPQIRIQQLRRLSLLFFFFLRKKATGQMSWGFFCVCAFWPGGALSPFRCRNFQLNDLS